MPVEVAQGILNITPSMRGLQGLIDREMRGVNSRRAGQQAGEEYQGGFGASAKKLTGILAGAFAAVKIGDFAKSAVDQASDLNEVGTKMQVVFGDANEQVQKFASQGAKALGLSSLEAQNAAASFGVFGKSAGLAGKDQADFSTGMAKLAVDMASFSNTTPEDAIEALSSGLRGEAEPLRKYGVLLDDATLRTQAMKMGLISTTKDALTPQQKVLAAHAVILEQTKDAQGDFERTSSGLANQQRILSAQWTDMKGKLGAAFLPAVNAVVTGLNDTLFPTLDAVGSKASAAWHILSTGDFPGASAGLGEEDSPLVTALLYANKTFSDLKPQLKDAWTILSGGDFRGFDKGNTSLLSEGLAGALFSARDAFEQVGPALKEAWSILSGGDFKGGLGFEEDSAFVDFMFKLRDIGLDVFQKIKDIWDELWSLGEKLWPSIESIGKSFFEAWQKINDSGWSAFSLVFDAIKIAVDAVVTVLNATLVPALDWLARFFRENPGEVYILIGAFTAWKVATLASAAATWLVEAATKAWAIAQGILNAVMDANPISIVIIALAAFAAAVVWAYNNVDWFRNIVDTVWSFIKEATTQLWETVLKPIFQWIGENIHVVGDAFSWLWTTVSNVWQWISDKVSTVWTFIRDSIFAPLGTGITNIGTFFSGLWTTVQNVWSWIQEKIDTVWKWLNQNVFAPLNLALSTMGTFFSNLWTTVQTVWNNVSTFFVNVAKGISDAVTTVKTAIGDIKKEIDGFFERFQNWGGTSSGGVLGNIDLTPHATGTVVPGYAPGVDNYPALLSPGESVLVPQLTRQLGPSKILQANAAAYSGGDGASILRLATGGVIGGQQAGALIGARSSALITFSRDEIKKAFEASPAGGASNGNWGPGVSGAFAANTAAAKAFIEKNFSGVSSIGGLYGGSVPGSDHPMGKALDVMIANYLSQQGIAAGTKIADWFIQNPNSFGTKYVIWRDRISQGGQWSPYSHPSGNNDTLQHRDHVHISFLTGSGQFQAGGATPSAADDTQSALGKILAKVRGQAGSSGGVAAAYDQGAGVEQWRGLGIDVLSRVGAYKGMNLLPYINNMMNQIRTESSGNPNAINLTDINAQRGDPSIGLLQVIGSTFRNALRGTPFEGLIAAGQRDPRASLTASTLYSLGRYGTLDKAWRGVAYANGGIVPDSIPGMLTPGEGVFTKPQTDAIITHAKALEAGFAGKIPNIVVNNYIDGQQLDARTEVLVDGKLFRLADAVDMREMQSL